MTCECRICVRHRSIRQTVRDGDVEELRALVKDLSSDWDNAEMDRDYYRAIIDGSWPSADAIIANMRENLKKQAEASDG